MPTLAWRLRIRNVANSADELVITSLDGGTNPYIAEPPSGDGQTVNPVTGEVQVGGFTVSVIDAETAPNTRVVTSKLADEAGRQQLLSRRAFIEESENAGVDWDVLAAGYVNTINMVSALRFVFTVGESRRAEQRIRVFERAEPGLDRVSCILGGPIIGDFGPYADFGRPRFTVASVSGDRVVLTWTGGSLLPRPIHEDTPPIPSYNRNHINRVAFHYMGAREAAGATAYPDLVCRLFDIGTEPGVVSNPPAGLTAETQDFTPLGHPLTGIDFLGFQVVLVNNQDQISIRWPDAGTRPAPGVHFKLVIFPRHIDERNALHWRGHPIDFATSLLTLRGEAYHAASAAAVKAELGPDLEIEIRITKSMSLAEALETIVYGPFGVGARTNAAGEREFFSTRRRPSVAPMDIITNDELTTDEGSVWGLEERSAVSLVTFKTRAFTPLPGGEPTSTDAENPIDWLGVSSVVIEAEPDPSENQPTDGQTVSYDLPGYIVGMATGTPEAPGDLDHFVGAIGAELFDFQGRGAITTELPVRRGVTTAQVGQEIILNLPQLPTASPDQTPKSQRGTVPRLAVVLRRTPTPSGPILKVQDRGIAPPIELLPVFTISGAAIGPKTHATITILNAGSLALAGCLIRVQVATLSGPFPSSGHTVRILNPATEATVFDLTAAAGSQIWVRLRAEKSGQPAGPFTDWQTVILEPLNAPTNFTGATLDGAKVALAWTLGESDYLVFVSYATVTEPNIILRSLLLPAGSTRLVLPMPDGDVDYVFSVRHRELPPLNGMSTAATTVVRAGLTDLLDPPRDPAVFAYGDGVFGLSVFAAAHPTKLEIWQAVEAAAGSGLPGAYELVGVMRSPIADAVAYEAPPAPNDGKRRYLKARHVRDGAVPSNFTTPQEVDPWTATDAPRFDLFRDGSAFVDDFSQPTPGRRWEQLNKGEPGAGTFRDVYDPDALVGGRVGRATGRVHLQHADRVPFEPILYPLHMRVRQLRAPTQGPATFSLGLAGFAQDPVRPDRYEYVNVDGANLPTRQHYVLADNLSLPASREWTDFYAFVKGHAGGRVELSALMISQVGFPQFDAEALVNGSTDPTNIGLSTEDAEEGAYVLISSPGKPLDLAGARMCLADGGGSDEWEFDFADLPGGPWTEVPS